MVDFLDIFLKIIIVIGTLVGGLWAFTKYVIEKGLVPAAELDVDCTVIGEKKDRKIIEITIHIFNKGTSILIAKDICLILKTICTSDESLSLYEDERKFGRLRFPHSLGDNLTEKHENNESNAFKLVPHTTFVQPGVNQKYPFVTVINKNTEFLFAHAEFQYAQKPRIIQRLILWISRRIGLIQYTLQHIYKPHTVQKAFNMKNERIDDRLDNR